MATSSSTTSTTTTTTPKKGVAGRIDYDSWEKRTSHLSKQLEEEEEAERLANASALGLDGKHARSEAEAVERAKAAELQKTKSTLDAYKQREEDVVENLTGLLGSVDDDIGATEEGSSSNKQQASEHKL